MPCHDETAFNWTGLRGHANSRDFEGGVSNEDSQMFVLIGGKPHRFSLLDFELTPSGNNVVWTRYTDGRRTITITEGNQNENA